MEIIQFKLKLELSKTSLSFEYALLELPKTQELEEKVSRNLYAWDGILGVVNLGFGFIQNFLTFIISCTLIIFINMYLVIIIFLIAIFKYIIQKNTRIREKNKFYDLLPPINRRINYTQTIGRNVEIGKDLRIYNMNKFIKDERSKAVIERMKLEKSNQKRNFLAELFIHLLNILDNIALYGFLIYAVLYNGLSIANFSFYVSTVSTLSSSLRSLIDEYSYILTSSLNANDYVNYFKLDYIIDESSCLEIDEINEVEFKNVYFSYHEQDNYTLENCSFKINKNEKLALVGLNGAGKTTICKLLIGFYKVNKGEILINGININSIKRSSLVKCITPVFQETILYSLSLASNVSMSKTCDKEKLFNILKTVDLYDKVMSLPAKEDTIITKELNDEGISLSGGENQKVSLARAIYKKNYSFFILDEPTSAMDALSEYNMYNNFNQITSSKIIIYISHRLSSTKFCDKIIFLENGKVSLTGTHQELMGYDNEYKKLFSVQQNYYIKGSDDNEESN